MSASSSSLEHLDVPSLHRRFQQAFPETHKIKPITSPLSSKDNSQDGWLRILLEPSMQLSFGSVHLRMSIISVFTTLLESEPLTCDRSRRWCDGVREVAIGTYGGGCWTLVTCGWVLGTVARAVSEAGRQAVICGRRVHEQGFDGHMNEGKCLMFLYSPAGLGEAACGHVPPGSMESGHVVEPKRKLVSHVDSPSDRTGPQGLILYTRSHCGLMHALKFTRHVQFACLPATSSTPLPAPPSPRQLPYRLLTCVVHPPMPPKPSASSTQKPKGPSKQELEAINAYLTQKPDFDKLIAETKANPQPAPERKLSEYERKVKEAVKASVEKTSAKQVTSTA